MKSNKTSENQDFLSHPQGYQNGRETQDHYDDLLSPAKLPQVGRMTRSEAQETLGRLVDELKGHDVHSAAATTEWDPQKVIALRGLLTRGVRHCEDANIMKNVAHGHFPTMDQVKAHHITDRALVTIHNALQGIQVDVQPHPHSLAKAIEHVLPLASPKTRHGLPGLPLSDWQLTLPRVDPETAQHVGIFLPSGDYVELPRGSEVRQWRTFGPFERRTTMVKLPTTENGSERSVEEVTPMELLENNRLAAAPADSISYATVSQRYDTLRGLGSCGPDLALAYLATLSTNPELGVCQMRFCSPDNYAGFTKTGGYAVHPGNSELSPPRPVIVLHVNQEEHLYQELLETRQTSAQSCADKLGIRSHEMTPRMLGVFIFLHELGHALDYLNNFSPLDQWRERRTNELRSLPVPSYNPVTLALALEPGGTLVQWWDENQAQIAAAGYPTKNSLIKAQEAAYHDLPSEDFADKFAVKVMHDHGLIKLLA